MIINQGLGIRMILAQCNKQLINDIACELFNKLSQFDSNVWIDVSYVGKYWKYPGEYEVTITVKSNTLENFEILTGLFPMHWNYFTNDADWSKHMHPDEIFLNVKVNWVNVFNWGEADTEDVSKNQVICTLRDCGFYYCQWILSSRLKLFANFLFHDVTQNQNKEIQEKIASAKDEVFVCCSLKRVGDNFHLNYPFTPVEDLIIPTEELFQLIQKWQELTAKKVSPIVISDRNGKIEIAGE